MFTPSLKYFFCLDCDDRPAPASPPISMIKNDDVDNEAAGCSKSFVQQNPFPVNSKKESKLPFLSSRNKKLTLFSEIENLLAELNLWETSLSDEKQQMMDYYRQIQRGNFFIFFVSFCILR